jgi:hypothetical protein
MLIVTWIGFLDHYGNLQGWRWLTTFIPVLIGWVAIAPWLGVYRQEVANQPAQVWRPFIAAVLAAPLAATLRGFWLNGAILPIFVVVLGLTNALGFLVWRLIWIGVRHWLGRRAVRYG